MAAIVGEHAERLTYYAALLGKRGKGVLSLGESTGTLDAQLALPASSKSKYPPSFVLDDLIFGTPGAFECLSGVILSPDDFDRKTAAGQRFVDVLKSNGVIPGVQVDSGIGKLNGSSGEATTLGLSDLDSRCRSYFEAGARFAKWRAVLGIAPSHPLRQAIHEKVIQPSQLAINDTADKLARCASICQKNGLVPILEPEILADGGHDIQRCEDVTKRVLAACYKALLDKDVLLEGTVLKLNMVTPGSNARSVAPEVVAEHTLRVLQRTVPAAVPTVLLFSGDSEEETPHYLNAIIKREGQKPWRLSFSFGRCVSTGTMTSWGGKEMKTAGVRAAFLASCKANSQATLGTYVHVVPSIRAQMKDMKLKETTIR